MLLIATHWSHRVGCVPHERKYKQARSGRLAVRQAKPGCDVPLVCPVTLPPGHQAWVGPPYMCPCVAIKSESDTALGITPALIEEMEAVSGVQVEYQRTGSLHVVTDQDEDAYLRRYEQAWRARGAEVAWVTGDELRRSEPLLNPEITIALSIPHAASIKPRLMTQAYAEAARRLSALISEHIEVTGLQHNGGKVTGIQVRRGELFACERVVIAAGAWSAQVGSWLGLDIPVFPARGQILSLWQPATRLKRTIVGRDIYVVPKVDHTIYVGATVEQVGLEKSNTAGGLLWLLSRAIDLLPELEGAALAQIWSGLRPWSQDAFPILGKAPGWENVILATGHGASGFELSAITGKTIGEVMTTGQTPSLIQPFGLERFKG